MKARDTAVAWLVLGAIGWLAATLAAGQTAHEPHHHQMDMDRAGMVMHENRTTLPRGCERINGERAITVRAGRRYAEQRPGSAFGMDKHSYTVPACSRVTVTFINEDEIRHQWMVHGLPTYLYPRGMFHIEAAGGHRKTGTFIVPSDDRTYLVHCDMAQHMEKGMKAQLKVGQGSGDLPSIPTVSRAFSPDNYLPDGAHWWIIGASLAGLCAGWALLRKI